MERRRSYIVQILLSTTPEDLDLGRNLRTIVNSGLIRSTTIRIDVVKIVLYRTLIDCIAETNVMSDGVIVRDCPFDPRSRPKYLDCSTNTNHIVGTNRVFTRKNWPCRRPIEERWRNSLSRIITNVRCFTIDYGLKIRRVIQRRKEAKGTNPTVCIWPYGQYPRWIIIMTSQRLIVVSSCLTRTTRRTKGHTTRNS